MRLNQKTHVLGKQMWYGDTFYYTKFDKIFGKGGLSHIVKELHDIKQGANNLDIKCLQTGRIDTIFLLVL